MASGDSQFPIPPAPDTLLLAPSLDCLFSLFQLSYIAEDENGKIVGYVLAKM